MNEDLIAAVSEVLDDILRLLGHRSHPQARTSDNDAAQRAPVAVGVVAACHLPPAVVATSITQRRSDAPCSRK
jgi:hypothetical protein